jgi:hypothetical protein
MFYRYSLMLVRSAAVTATLFALIAILMVPTRAPTMELKIVGNQLFLSGPVVGDEPLKRPRAPYVEYQCKRLTLVTPRPSALFPIPKHARSRQAGDDE